MENGKTARATQLIIKQHGLYFLLTAGSVVHPDHHVAGLDDGIGLAADLEAELVDRGHGDHGTDDDTAAQVDLDDAVDRAFLDLRDGALKLISRAEFHEVILLSMNVSNTGILTHSLIDGKSGEKACAKQDETA